MSLFIPSSYKVEDDSQFKLFKCLAQGCSNKRYILFLHDWIKQQPFIYHKVGRIDFTADSSVAQRWMQNLRCKVNISCIFSAALYIIHSCKPMMFFWSFS